MTGVDTDDRIAKRADNGVARRDRQSTDRTITQDRGNTDSVRRAERRSMLTSSDILLPQPPKIAGYHLFWATTTNTKDSIENRQRLGYEFVKRAELPDFNLNTQKAGELTEDRIMVNEMVLMKINEADFVDDMLYKHHDLPTEAIDNLKNSIRMERDGKGRNVAFTGGEFQGGLADGFHSLRSNSTPSLEGVV